jgi:hypothetical protein
MRTARRLFGTALLAVACTDGNASVASKSALHILVYDNTHSRDSTKAVAEYLASVRAAASKLQPGDCYAIGIVAENPLRGGFPIQGCFKPAAHEDWVIETRRSRLADTLSVRTDSLLSLAERPWVSPLFEVFYAVEPLIAEYQSRSNYSPEIELHSDGILVSGGITLPTALDTADVDSVVARVLARHSRTPNLEGIPVRLVFTGGGAADSLSFKQDEKLHEFWAHLIVAMNGRLVGAGRK